MSEVNPQGEASAAVASATPRGKRHHPLGQRHAPPPFFASPRGTSRNLGFVYVAPPFPMPTNGASPRGRMDHAPQYTRHKSSRVNGFSPPFEKHGIAPSREHLIRRAAISNDDELRVRGAARVIHTREPPPPPPGMYWKGRDLRGGPRSGSMGGWRRLPKRLGAVTVGYKCH